jgi:hypothetical protein
MTSAIAVVERIGPAGKAPVASEQSRQALFVVSILAAEVEYASFVHKRQKRYARAKLIPTAHLPEVAAEDL